LLTKELDDSMGGAPVQVRVVQNKEPPHFYRIFKGKMVVHSGGKASGFKNRSDVDSFDKDGTRLFQIKGTNQYNVRAVQVPEVAASLNSGDAFILETPNKVFLWCGSGSTGDEREFAKTISKEVTKREFELVPEGKEPEAFWSALGGKAPYAATKAPAGEFKEPRLFQCTNAVGYFRVEEVFDFDQEDLIEDDVMILDTYFEVFVWIGKGANTEEKKKAMESAMEFVKTDPSGRDPQATVFIAVKQGFEPPSFTAHFHGWDANKFSSGKSYEQLKAELGGELTTSVAASLDSLTALKAYPLDVILRGPLPEGVDAGKKEFYLSDADFQKVLGMSKLEYGKLPGWKQAALKKKAHLY
jgi:hypothetical protein